MNYLFSVLNVLSVAFSPIIKIFINGQLQNGFPIPLVENITFGGKSQVVTFDTGELRIDADLVYV